jgi:serine/threonine-protein kinase
LSLYQEIEEEVDFDGFDLEESDFDPDADKLMTGYVLKGTTTEYTIHKFLGHGYFGYTYSAQAHNLTTGERKEVVLKEFYPYTFFRREGVQAILMDEDESDFIEDSRAKFMEEARIMNKLGTINDSHIVPAFELFRSEETQTEYYVMPFYHDGSLDDLQNTGFAFTEDLVLKHVVKPLCKALHIAHSSKVLHLDIKPENILIDEQGDAVLIDFGVARQYDKEGNVVDNRGAKSQSMFAAPELMHGNMVKFGSQTDIYGLASSLYYLLCAPETPHPIFDFSDQDEDLRENLAAAKCSDKFIDAIIAGLQFSATSRPANAQKFLNLFPGCENIKL